MHQGLAQATRFGITSIHNLDEAEEGKPNLLLLQEVTAALVALASCSDTLPMGPATDRALDQAQQALRRALTHRPNS
jgi:hypothetical protein